MHSAVERVGSALDAARSDATNAFTSIDELARARAEAIDRSNISGPLAGTPLAVKDLIDHAGRTTTAGSGFYRNHATSTAPAIERLEDAGLVVVGRTGLHEFAFGFSSENPWFGPVLNPWDPTLSPGGSSGGSAAAVAAGIVPLALGTDTGGSVRVPAALCGVIGLKVTHGLIPLTGVFPLVPSLDTVGAIGSDLDLVAEATRVMAGSTNWNPGPPTTVPTLRLAVPRGWLDGAPFVGTVAEDFADWLEMASDSGAELVDVDLSEAGNPSHVGAVIGPEVAEVHREWRESGEPYGDDVGERIDAALAVTDDEASAGSQWRADVIDAVRSVVADGTIIVTPTVAGLDKRIGDDTIDGKFYRPVLSYFSAPVNQSGSPALSIPMAGAGRRPSIQLIGQRGSEGALVAAGAALQAAGILGLGRGLSDDR